MKEHYPLLGLDTASRRFDASRGGRFEFYDRLRALEASVTNLNLTPEFVHLAAELAALEPALGADDRIALIVLILISFAALQEGSTRFAIAGSAAAAPLRRMLGQLCADGFGKDGIETIAASIELLLETDRASAVIGREEADYKPLLYIAPFIVHQRIHHCEGQLANRLVELVTTDVGQPDAENLAGALKEVIGRSVIVNGNHIVLSDEQRNVVAASARAGMTVVSGGPGTGKTSIIVAILRLMVRLGIAPAEIALAAPTGKAAYRMGECIHESLMQIVQCDSVDQSLLDAHLEPATIHRLLGYSSDSGRFRHHRNNPLAARVVIIDEGSMLDVTLMERLVSAIQPGARLIILGDANQLPSVTAGAVFRDLADSTGPFSGASVRLSVNYRMKSEDAAGRSILLAAQSINSGALPDVTRRFSPGELTFSGVEFLAGSSRDLGPFLDRWYANRIRAGAEFAEMVAHEYIERDGRFDDADCKRLRALFAYTGISRILCVTRVFETGAEQINARLHARAAEAAGVRAERAAFVVGEPLIVLRNDYDRGLFNGDSGLRLWVRPAGGTQVPMAVFPRGDNFVAFRFDALREVVELGYAMTIHKAQGSEFDSVAIILSERPVAVLTRELLYTAISRSRTSAVIVGDESVMRDAIATRVERFSGLSDRIRSAIPG